MLVEVMSMYVSPMCICELYNQVKCEKFEYSKKFTKKKRMEMYRGFWTNENILEKEVEESNKWHLHFKYNWKS